MSHREGLNHEARQTVPPNGRHWADYRHQSDGSVLVTLRGARGLRVKLEYPIPSSLVPGERRTGRRRTEVRDGTLSKQERRRWTQRGSV